MLLVFCNVPVCVCVCIFFCFVFILFDLLQEKKPHCIENINMQWKGKKLVIIVWQVGNWV